MPSTIEPTSAAVGLAKNHQCGCRSSATASLSLSSFFGYGMDGNSTALTLGAMDPSTLLDDLDAEQRHAVATDSRLVAVIAGAGSGKTRVLTRRIAHRVVTGTADAPPHAGAHVHPRSGE